MTVLIALGVSLLACVVLGSAHDRPAWADHVLGVLALAPIAFLVIHGIAL